MPLIDSFFLIRSFEHGLVVFLKTVIFINLFIDLTLILFLTYNDHFRLEINIKNLLLIKLLLKPFFVNFFYALILHFSNHLNVAKLLMLFLTNFNTTYHQQFESPLISII